MITYSNQINVTVETYIDLLKRSTLALRRPIDQPKKIAQVLKDSDILWTAWDQDQLIGVARALIDSGYDLCYLSDLAVDANYQKQGIGKTLVNHLNNQIGQQTKLYLLAAPKAMEYYPKIGFDKVENAFQLRK